MSIRIDFEFNTELFTPFYVMWSYNSEIKRVNDQSSLFIPDKLFTYNFRDLLEIENSPESLYVNHVKNIFRIKSKYVDITHYIDNNFYTYINSHSSIVHGIMYDWGRIFES